MEHESQRPVAVPPEQRVTPRSTSNEPSLSAMLAQLRKQFRKCQTTEEVFLRLMEFALEQLSVDLVRVDYRQAAATQVQRLHKPDLPEKLAAKLCDEWMGPLATEMQSDVDSSTRSKTYRRQNQIIQLFVAPVLDEQSGLAEGALTVLCGRRHSNPIALAAQIDALAAMASAALTDILTAASLAAATAAADQARAAAAKVAESSAEVRGAQSDRHQSTSQLPNPGAMKAVFAAGSLREFAFTLVNTIANQARAEQVGFGSAADGRVRVQAISGLPDFKTHSPGVALIQQAMEECLDHEGLILHQADLVDGQQFAIHRRWSSETGGCALFSLPLTDSQGTVAIVSLRRTADRPFSKEEVVSLMQSLQSYATAIRMLENAGRPLRQQLASKVRQPFQKQSGLGWAVRRVALLAVVVFGLWCVFGTLTYKPLCTATVTAENMRRMTSSMSARLKAVHVRAGESVQAGQLLAEFDTTEAQLQLHALQRDIASSEVETRRAIDQRDTSSAALSQARVGVLMAQADAVRARIKNSYVLAPEDGFIVRADVETRIGQTVPAGEVILEFAAQGGWLLEIQVPDDIGTLVQTGQDGSFAAASLTSQAIPFQIQSMEGTTQIVDGNNVFLVRANLAERPVWMKSGMQGTAKVTTVDKPVWWVALHRVVDWCRLSFWV